MVGAAGLAALYLIQKQQRRMYGYTYAEAKHWIALLFKLCREGK